MRAQLLHLSGPFRGRTIVYEPSRLLLGCAPGATVRYPPRGDMKERHAEIEFVKEGCSFYLRAIDGQVFVNRQEVREVILEHGDLVEVGVGGPKFRFRVAESGCQVCKPVRQMLTDAAEVRGQSGLWASTHGLQRDLLLYSTRTTKVAALLLAAAAVFALTYLGGTLSGSRVSREHQALSRRQSLLYESQIRNLERQMERFRRDQAGHASKDQLDALRADLARRARIVDAIADRSLALKRVLDEYSRGVCLIHGVYTFFGDVEGEPIQVTGAGEAPLQLEYIGTGFLASSDGHVITNRHVAQPWWNHDQVAPLLAQGLSPRFVSLTVVFPGTQPASVDPTTIQLSDENVDMATLHVPVGAGVPVLPLFDGELAGIRGGRVILLGYPTGLNALLARAEPSVVEGALAAAADTATLIAQLAHRDVISPVITQGALNEVRPRRLVYDAETTSGGSGGPVFGSEGTVIGVNFAVTRDFDGSNFGVPITFARRLLQRKLP